jgi:hypothetical protein
MAEVRSGSVLMPLNFNFLKFWRILSGNLRFLKSLKEWGPQKRPTVHPRITLGGNLSSVKADTIQESLPE